MDLTTITLEGYLAYLKERWDTFEVPLYSLDTYLCFGAEAWKQENERSTIDLDNVSRDTVRETVRRVYGIDVG